MEIDDVPSLDIPNVAINGISLLTENIPFYKQQSVEEIDTEVNTDELMDKNTTEVTGMSETESKEFILKNFACFLLKLKAKQLHGSRSHNSVNCGALRTS